jgi:uncharacterized membrane-anchored protein YitT (DUF2179 family)
MNLVYPRHRKVRINISSTKMNEIIKYLKESKFHHPFALKEEHSIYSKKDNEILTTVIYYLEVNALLSSLEEIDKDIWVSIILVERTFGNFSDKLLI